MSDSPVSIQHPNGEGCPRCSAKLPRTELVKHLWLQHGLLVDGDEVREPWELIEAWIRQYCQEGNPELLLRCRALAQRVDPAVGPQRVQRLFLAHGIEDADARERILTAARLQRASVCPQCYTLVPVPEDTAVPPLNVRRGRLSAGGYRVEVAHASLRSRLEIETPQEVLYQGREPDRRLTRKGAMYLLVGPPVLLAWLLLLSVLFGFVGLAPLWWVIGLLFLALVLFADVEMRWPARETAANRALHYAWTFLVPRLHADGFSAEDSAFVAGLALACASERYRVEIPWRTLRWLLDLTERAVAVGDAPVSQLAALWRLGAADTARTGGDAVRIVAAEAARCFTGALPLAYADELLAGCLGDGWAAGHLNRLRVLLCEQAFEAGLEVRNLLALKRSAPALAAVVRIQDAHNLACLRLLWSLRPVRPWDRCGDARTVFELASGAAARERLERRPDLLLETEQAPVVDLCGRGLYFQGKLFKEAPRRIEVKRRRRARRKGYDLILDGRRLWFPYNPADQVRQLGCWSRYHFDEFLPQVAEVLTWESPHSLPLSARGTATCPECRKELIARPGDMAELAEDDTLDEQGA